MTAQWDWSHTQQHAPKIDIHSNQSQTSAGTDEVHTASRENTKYSNVHIMLHVKLRMVRKGTENSGWSIHPSIHYLPALHLNSGEGPARAYPSPYPVIHTEWQNPHTHQGGILQT